MAANADSDNESVLSSLPSSPYSGVEAEEEQEEEQEDNENSQSDSNDKQDQQQSDADTEPLPPSSSAARRRLHDNTNGNGGGTRRTILQTESSSSGSGEDDDEDEQTSRSRRMNASGRDTLTVPSNMTSIPNTSSRIPSTLASSTRRMSFDDGSDLSALTSEAEDIGDGEAYDDDEEDNDNGKGTTGDHSTINPKSSNSDTRRHGRRRGRRRPTGSSSTRKTIGQQQHHNNAEIGDNLDDDDEEEEEDAAIAGVNNGSASSSMDEEDEEDEEDEDEFDDDDDDDDEDEEHGDGDGNSNNKRARSSSHGRGRGRPPKRQNALAAAAKRAAAKSSSHGGNGNSLLGGARSGEAEDEDEDEEEEDYDDDDDDEHEVKKERHPSDVESDNIVSQLQSRNKTKAKPANLQVQSQQLGPSASTSTQGTEGESLDADEQLAQDLLHDEEEELAEVAKHLDDSEDEDYLDSSTARGRALLASARRRKAQQLHSGSHQSASTTSTTTGRTPKRASASARERGESTSLPPLSSSGSNNKNNLGSPTSRNGGKLLVGATSNGSLAKKRGAASAASKRGGSGVGASSSAAAALQRHRLGGGGELDEDQMDIDSQAHLSDHYDSDAATSRPDEGEDEAQLQHRHRHQHHDNGNGNAQIIVTDVNGELDPTSSTSTSIPLSAKALSQAGVKASAIAGSNLDADDAMSGISEDIPISSQARAQAQAALAAAAAATAGASSSLSSSSSIIPRLAISTTHADGLMGLGDGGRGPNSPLSRDEGTPDEETTAPSTPMLPLPSSGFPSGAGGNLGISGRRKSPAPETGTARGRGGRGGRGFGRGRAKKLAQARFLAAQHGDEDGEVSTSAAEDHDRELTPGHETGAGSDHEDDTGDAGAAKKRQEAIEALTKIEIEFAQLRDKMYLEKMEEIARERWQIENGVHPEHIHLVHLIEHRRKAKLELARKILKEAEAAQLKKSESEVRFCWSQWMHGRHDLVHTMVEDMNHKRRRLDREKRAIERPRNEELTTILRMHAPPPYMFYEKKHAASYGRDYSLEYEVAENMQKKRKSGAVGLDHDEAMYDLERMGLRDPYRGTYPPHFHYDPAYAVGPAGLASNRPQHQTESSRPNNSAFPHESNLPSATAGPSAINQQSASNATAASSQSPSNNPLAAAQGRTVASVSQQHAPTGLSGRADPFSAYRMQTPTSMTSSAGGAPLSHMQISSPNIASASRPPSGPRPTLDDHLGYSTTGHARSASQSSTSILPGHERQTSRSQQRYDYTSGAGSATKSLGETATGANRFIPSYYAALGAQRS